MTECISMLDNVVRQELPGLESFDYAATIASHGGVQQVAAGLVEMIRPEIRLLEGQRITPEVLLEVSAQQTHRWPRFGGYMSAITDDRKSDYLRLYVGQSKTLCRRILRGHTQEILRSSYSTLHYFIIWLGNGHRTANFSLLWSAPPDSIWDDWLSLQFNLLEALFCRAFQTHHGCLSPEADRRPGMGLNIISPLLQGRIMSEVQKLQQVGQVSSSSDPQIAKWVSFRAQKRSKGATATNTLDSNIRIWLARHCYKVIGAWDETWAKKQQAEQQHDQLDPATGKNEHHEQPETFDSPGPLLPLSHEEERIFSEIKALRRVYFLTNCYLL
ncbi:hypothetical protein B0I35DRAFT_440443, partial [Stachybotrys elegans]